MTDAKTEARKQAIDYLVRMLQMNPAHEGEAIVRARSAALRLKTRKAQVTATPTDQLRDERRRVIEQLERLRAGFWTMSPDALQEALRQLDACTLPDVKLAVGRLRTVARFRSVFPRLSQMPGFDGELFGNLKRVLIESPHEIAVLKEQVLSSFRNRAHRKRLRSMVRLIETEVPEIYQLEADWFKALYRQKSTSRQVVISGASRSVTSNISFGGYGWLIWIIVIAIIRAIVATNRN